jgi:hypothetical protein
MAQPEAARGCDLNLIVEPMNVYQSLELIEDGLSSSIRTVGFVLELLLGADKNVVSEWFHAAYDSGNATLLQEMRRELKGSLQECTTLFNPLDVGWQTCVMFRWFKIEDEKGENSWPRCPL